MNQVIVTIVIGPVMRDKIHGFKLQKC